MASFSRSLCYAARPRSLIALRAILPDLPCAPPQSFTTSLRLRAAASLRYSSKSTKPLVKSIPSTKPSGSPTASPAPSRYAFIKNLASKPTPTLLYEAPSHFWFYFGCWSSGLSIITWTVLTGPTAIQQPEDVPRWVGYTFAASYALLGAMGFYLISKTPNIVSSIRLLPPAHVTGKTVAVRPGTATALPQLEVRVKRMIPLLSQKIVKVDLDKASLKSRFSLPIEYVPELKRLEQEREEENRKKALWKFDMEHLLTMPFRRIGRAFVGLFRGVRAAWTGAGYGIIKVDGKEYKVDVMEGYAHDGFRTLERIISIDGM